jgi:predicted PurR-regulated permease PerM
LPRTTIVDRTRWQDALMSENVSEPAIISEGPAPPRRLTPISLFLILVVGYVLVEVRVVVVVALLALLYATVIERPVRALERRHVPRRAAVLLIDIALVGGLIVPALLIAPAAGRELDRFRREEPTRLRETEASWATSSHALLRGPGRRLLERVSTAIETPTAPSKQAANSATRALKMLLAGLACLVMAYYYLLEKALLRQVALDAIRPTERERWARLWDEVERAIGGWLRSRLLLGPIAGVVTIIAFGILRLPYWPLLGLLAMLTEPIPILGAWIGGAPAVFLALTISWQRALLVLAFILVRQSLIDTIVLPRLTEREVGMSPFTVFVAVVAGTKLFGPIGAVLAIPIAAAIQIFVRDALAQSRAVGQDPVGASWRWLRSARF